MYITLHFSFELGHNVLSSVDSPALTITVLSSLDSSTLSVIFSVDTLSFNMLFQICTYSVTVYCKSNIDVAFTFIIYNLS